MTVASSYMGVSSDERGCRYPRRTCRGESILFCPRSTEVGIVDNDAAYLTIPTNQDVVVGPFGVPFLRGNRGRWKQVKDKRRRLRDGRHEQGEVSFVLSIAGSACVMGEDEVTAGTYCCTDTFNHPFDIARRCLSNENWGSQERNSLDRHDRRR